MSSRDVSFIRSCQRKWSNGELPTKVQGNRVALLLLFSGGDD
ncbi:hypothetical protein SLEP1_g59843 [Rubroshorea leprosula]|uniref:Uncharacterized protein n=1 Tax=Rubroshorea leprosula TaxID=152421 RepID=A0AAV5MX64_9ROSI|nr:hypothetical protein SLEP1_g59843 [Rubroshorea leprosula]